MDLSKLAQLAKSNPAAAKAFLNKIEKKTEEPRQVRKQDQVFTRQQLETIVTALVEKEVGKIPKPKDGKTPTKDEITKLIQPLIPVLRQPKDGKDAKITSEHLDKVVTKVLKQVAINPDVTRAVVNVLEKEYDLSQHPVIKKIQDRLEQIRKDQTHINRGVASGYTDQDVRRVINEEGGLGSSVTFKEGDGNPSVEATTVVFPNGTLTDNGNGQVTYDPGALGGGDMVTSTYDPANKAEQVLTVSDIDDTAYNATSWNGDTDTAPSKNTVRDKFEALDAAKASASHTHTLSEITDFDANDYATGAEGDLASSALQNVVEDTTPQLGGNLDAQNNSIQNLTDVETDTVTADSSAGLALRNSGGTTVATLGAGVGTGTTFAGGVNTGALGVTGDITVSGTVDGRDVAADGTKLDGIEVGADVTDATNVEAAGALMDSEVTNLAQVKAFDSSDYATAAQGALADSAVQPGDDADTLGSGAATDGWVLTADGAGGAAWEAVPASGGGDAWGDPVDADIVPDTTNTRDLGSSAVEFAEAHIRTVVTPNLKGRTASTTFLDSSDNTIAQFVGGTGVVNNFAFDASTTGNPVVMEAQGTDTNVSINLVPKGTGEAQVNGQRILDETDLASPTLTGTTTTDLFVYDAARGKVTAGGNLGTTETINFNDETNYTGNLDNDITFTFSNATSGDEVTLYLTYSGAQRTITWPSVTWLDNNNGSAPTTPSGAGEVLVVTVRYIGSTFYASATGNYAVYS